MEGGRSNFYTVLRNITVTINLQELESERDEPLSSAGHAVVKKRKKHFEKFFVIDSDDEDPSKVINGYGKGIPYPFPIDERFKKYLTTTTKEEFKQNYAAYNGVVRNVYEVIHQALKKKPERAFRERIAKGLVQEYPILKCGGDQKHSALSTSLRKRANNYHAKIAKIVSAPSTSKQKGPKSNDESESLSTCSQDTISTLEDRTNYAKANGIKSFFKENPDM